MGASNKSDRYLSPEKLSGWFEIFFARRFVNKTDNNENR